MKYGRGLFRLWVVFSVCWLFGSLYFLHDKLTATHLVRDCGPAPKFECLFAGDDDTKFKAKSVEADWVARGTAAKIIFAPPFLILIFGSFAKFAGSWVLRGFRGT